MTMSVKQAIRYGCPKCAVESVRIEYGKITHMAFNDRWHKIRDTEAMTRWVISLMRRPIWKIRDGEPPPRIPDVGFEQCENPGLPNSDSSNKLYL